MSASSKPTLAPSWANARARFTAVVLLPTPPLPEAMAMMFLTPGSGFRPRWTVWATILTVTLTLTLPTPGRPLSFVITARRMSSSWVFAG